FAKTYWGLFGGINVPMPDWTYTTLNTIAALALLGCVTFFVKSFVVFLSPSLRVSTSSLHFPQFPHFLVLAHLSLIFYGLIQWATITWSSQGRLVYSGISGIAVLYVIGMRTILPQRNRLFVLGAIALFMAAVSAVAPFAWIAPKYADPPALTAAQLAATPNRADADFGAINYPAEMRLLGYQMESASATPGGPVKVTLYWQSLVAMDRDWSVFVHVVDENQIVVAQRDTYPGLGLLPTRKWAVGQTVADTYVIPLPPTVYAPSDAHVEVGLYDYNTGERLPVVNGDQAGNDALTLSPLLIFPNAGDLPNPLAINFGNQAELAGYNMDRRAVAAGDSITLTLYWRGLRPMKTNYSVFAHVRGQGESLWA
ncbi:MAG: hypothetical protein AAB427_03625, partial [Chloroflexota bacterium]